MSRRALAATAAVAVGLVSLGAYGAWWILSQPAPPAETPVVGVEVPEATPEAPEETGKIRVQLYVPSSDGRSLTTETQEIELESSLQKQAKTVVSLLVRRSAAIPRGVELRELFITSQGIAYVDLSRELVANHPGGTSAEQLTVFGISNTLIGNFPAIQMVRILVEGREIQTLAGHLDLTIPYGRGPQYLLPESERVEPKNETS